MRLGLKNIVGLTSFRNTLLRDISGYYSGEGVIREITTFQNYHDYPIEVFYIVFTVSCICLIVLKEFKNREENKLNNLKEYRNTSRCINVFLIIFTMIFTKNIENAI